MHDLISSLCQYFFFQIYSICLYTESVYFENYTKHSIIDFVFVDIFRLLNFFGKFSKGTNTERQLIYSSFEIFHKITMYQVEDEFICKNFIKA